MSSAEHSGFVRTAGRRHGFDHDTIKELIDGKVAWPTLHEMLSTFKDPDRFDQVVSILQSRMPYSDQILLPYAFHLNVVQTQDGRRIIKSDCGCEFGDYRENWKEQALVYVRNTPETIKEIYPHLMGADPAWQEYREYYCPNCGTQLEVETVPAWYPPVHSFIPDLETFYQEWLGRSLPTRPTD
jgi:acetone carboxylase gamma subunit